MPHWSGSAGSPTPAGPRDAPNRSRAAGRWTVGGDTATGIGTVASDRTVQPAQLALNGIPQKLWDGRRGGGTIAVVMIADGVSDLTCQ